MPLVLAFAGLLIAVADVWTNASFAPLRRDLGEQVPYVFPMTGRLDLLVILALPILVAGVMVYEGRGSSSGQLRATWWLPALLALVLAGLGGWLLGPLTAVLVPVLFGVVVWAGPRLAGAQAADLVPALAVGLGLRMVVSFGLGLYGLASHSGVPVLDDEESLHRAAVELGPIMLSGFGYVQPAWRHLPSPYLSLLSAVYLVLGPDFTAIRLLNGAIAAMAVALVFGIVERLFGRRAASAAAWTVAVWPGVVLWTATGLRESLFTTASLVIPWLLTRRLAGLALPLGAVTAGIAVLVVGSLRSYAAAGLLAALAVAAARRKVLLAPALLVLGVLIWPRLAISQQITPRGVEYQAAAIELSTIPEADPQKRPPPPSPDLPWITAIVRVQLPGEDQLTTAVVYAYQSDPLRTVVATDRDTFYVLPPERVQFLSDNNVTWDVPLRRLENGLRLLFLPPAPWGSEPLQRLATIPDALAWDALLVVAAISVWQQRRTRALAFGLAMVYLLLMVGALGVVSSNLGTAVRHRGMLVPWVALLSAPALAQLALRSEMPRLSRVRTPSLT